MKKALISIIIPVYNSEKFISETIDSVINQTYKEWELIIVDDCSDDKSEDIIKNYQKRDSRIIYYKLEKNSGAAVCRNKAIKISNGEYIAFLDSDDIWKKEKLEKQLKFMEENNYAISFHEYEEINEKGEKLNIKITVPKNPITYRKYLLTNPIGCLTGMYNVKKIGKIYMPNLKKRQDTGFWLRILKLDKAYPLKENLAFYRVRKNSLSFKKQKLLKYHWMLYRKYEKLSILESSFYICSTVVTKILKLKEKRIKK